MSALLEPPDSLMHKMDQIWFEKNDDPIWSLPLNREFYQHQPCKKYLQRRKLLVAVHREYDLKRFRLRLFCISLGCRSKSNRRLEYNRLLGVMYINHEAGRLHHDGRRRRRTSLAAYELRRAWIPIQLDSQAIYSTVRVYERVFVLEITIYGIFHR